jgi:hypothetical protein
LGARGEIDVTVFIRVQIIVRTRLIVDEVVKWQIVVGRGSSATQDVAEAEALVDVIQKKPGDLIVAPLAVGREGGLRYVLS